MQEYIGNIAYAVILRRLATWALGLIVVVGGALLVWMAWRANSMDQGSDWTTIWSGSIRMGFSFPLGLWLYRVRHKFGRLRLGWGVLTLVLTGLFAMPLIPRSIPHGNGIYEAVVAILFFPMIILCGAHSELGRREMAICKFAGRMSYPIYILHFPFLLIFMNFVTFRRPPLGVAHLAGAGALAVVIAFSWLAVTFYDEPIRRVLRPLTRA
jgi:peptidoglycan/LPS O-acetylase OafA/YrhL